MRDFTEIERRMRFLVASLTGVLSDSERNEVLHFIEHGEYGVALENLKYAYDKNVTIPAKEVLSEMLDLAKKMQMKIN